MRWFLILILSTSDPTITRTVLIEQPDEPTCLVQLNNYIYTETVAGVDDVVEHEVLDRACRSYEGDSNDDA